jgi:large repetitive protein
VISGGSGDDNMLGGLGADTFKWTLSETGPLDTITDFDMAAPANGGDVLDLQDLLQNESVGNLSSYLQFEGNNAGGTLIKISANGEFNGDATHDANIAYQTIDLRNVDLLSLGGDQQIIDHLINNGKLITD